MRELSEGLPHGYVNGRDLSEPVRSASGNPALSELDIMKGYRWNAATRIERCQCGAEIEAINADRAIQYAVEIHNESTVHQQWRAWRDELS